MLDVGEGLGCAFLCPGEPSDKSPGELMAWYETINWLGIGIGALGAYALSSIWHTPVFWGRFWLKLLQNELSFSEACPSTSSAVSTFGAPSRSDSRFRWLTVFRSRVASYRFHLWRAGACLVLCFWVVFLFDLVGRFFVFDLPLGAFFVTSALLCFFHGGPFVALHVLSKRKKRTEPRLLEAGFRASRSVFILACYLSF